MSGRDVLVVRTGTANLASVLAGLARAGAAPRLASDPREVAAARRVVLPGVGSFGAAMDNLRADGLDGVLRERLESGRPLLAICLGLQVVAEASEESPGARGLGVIPDTVRRITGDVRVPQLGWNTVAPQDGCALLKPGHAYFANSYCLQKAPAGWSAALTEHGGPFVAALERGPQLLCQFHPELSGAWGLALLVRWLSAVEAAC